LMFLSNVLAEIIQWLENHDKMRLRRVSKQWNQIILASFR
jgi:hypothetical protein